MSHWTIFFVLLVSDADSLALQGVQLTGQTVLAVQALEDTVSQDVRGHPLTDSIVASVLSKIQRFYQDRGYAFARVELVRFDGPPQSLTMVLEVDPGPWVLIQNLRFTGLQATRPSVLQRRLARWVGKPFLPREVFRDIHGLTFELPQLQLKSWHFDRSGTLTLEFQERPANLLMLSLGIKRPSTLLGYAELHAPNLFGTARKLFLSWRRLSVDAQTWSLRYHEPWLFQTRVFLELFASMSFQKDAFLRQDQGIDLGVNGQYGTFQWGVVRSFRRDYSRQQTHLDWVSTFRIHLMDFHGFTLKFGFQGGRSLRDWQWTVAYHGGGLGTLLPTFLLWNPYAQGRRVTRSTGVTYADLFQAGGFEGPIGFPEGGLLLQDLWILGIRLKARLGNFRPFFQAEWATFYDLKQKSDKKSLGFGWTQAWKSQRVTLLYALPWGTPWTEGWLSLRMQTFF